MHHNGLTTGTRNPRFKPVYPLLKTVCAVSSLSLDAAPPPTVKLFPSKLIVRLTGCLFVSASAPPPTLAADMSPDQRALFESKIRPVLVKHCYECHSSGAKKIGGKLLLETPAGMLGGGQSGPVIVPGHPEESLLIQALRYEDLEMPPKHRLPAPVIHDFENWVKMGAPDPRNTSPASDSAPALTTDKAALWSFQPVSSPAPPAVKTTDWPRSTLDAFVLSKIEAAGLTPAQDAAPEVLVRRLFFDLTGLPPSAAEVRAFVTGCKSDRAGTLTKQVDSLLASSHFGEKWARHWLDVARYGESNGNDGLSRNPSFPHAWRYRDYVIRAFNTDLPYDRFLTEQIAGDLLSAGSAAERDRHLVATGFLAIGSKPAKAMNENFEMDVVADQIGVVGSGILGVSIACARCHDHKHDPISTKEYYALAGIFKSTETLWGAAAYEPLTAPQTPLHVLKTFAGVPPPPDAERPKPIKASKKKPAAPAFPNPPGTPLAMGVREAKTIDDCKINIGGESKKTGAAVPRGFPAVYGPADDCLSVMDSAQSGRLQLARWLTSGSHPQTARVFVNRVWLHLFGEGLVRTPDDFGVYGDRPLNVALLDDLASGFMKDGWSVKRLIRRIVLSRTWQLSSTCTERTRSEDPENTLFARHNRRRLDAEALRDAMLAASGELDRTPGSGSLIQHEDVLINEMGNLHRPSVKRSIYLLMLRNSMPPELVPFNVPDGLAVAGKRDVTTLPTQALYLLNNPFVLERATALAEALLTASKEDSQIVEAAYERVLARPPDADEMRRALDFLSHASATAGEENPALENARKTQLAAFCQALLASNAFRYLD